MPVKKPHLVVIGAGFAGLEVIKGLRNQAVDITLIDKNNYFNFQPLMYQVASGGLGADAIAYPLRKITGSMKNVQTRMTEVLEIIPQENKLITPVGEIEYDYLCIATGAKTNFFGNRQLEQFSMQLKSIPDALDLRSDILQEFEKAANSKPGTDLTRILNFVVVGAGPTGVETAGALAEIKTNVLPADYKEINPQMMNVYLIEAAPRVLSSLSEVSSLKAKKFLEELGVKVMLNTMVESYDANSGELKLNNGNILLTDTVIWSAGVMGVTLKGIPEECVSRGNRYMVDEYNQLIGLKNVYAIGDVALMTSDKAYPNGHPMVGTVAQQQGRLFAANMIRLLKNKPLKAYTYKNLGSMATVGRHKAVVEIFGFKTQGYFAWLIWMFLHLMLLVGFRNRLVVFVNWMWNYLSYDRAIRIITRPFEQKKSIE
jgi:NADH:ubiquinone reductase (H+-translocating)